MALCIVDCADQPVKAFLDKLMRRPAGRTKMKNDF
jgi:hypothetical protein